VILSICDDITVNLFSAVLSQYFDLILCHKVKGNLPMS
jgi:hypothetical protein